MSLSGPVVMAQVLDDEESRAKNNQELHLRSLTKSFCGIEKPLKNARSIASLPDLIQELHRVFDQDRVNIEYVNHIMLSYKSDPSEWKKFAKFDRFRYTRNLVDSGNGKFNLMILCWGSGHASAIHDHADSHCFMKMLNGQLAEVRYDWPKGNGSAAVEDGEIFRDLPEATDTEEQEELKEISRTTLEQNDVAYINDTLGLHRVENPDHSNVAVSLHLYCPPFDACHVFSKTGKQTKAKVTFWSVNGVRAKEAKD